MNFISDNSVQASANTQSTSLSDNLVYISLLASSNTTLNTTITTSNTNTSNYASNISNVLLSAISTNSGTSNYASNISNVLLSAISTNSGTSNYASNISNVLLSAISTNSGTSNYASNISNVLLSNSDATYLKLTGGNMNGSIGFGTSPDSKIHILTPDNAATTTNVFNFKNASGYGIYATSSSISARGNTLDFLARDYNGGTIAITNVITLYPNGNVGIGKTNPGNILQVGNAGRLRISNATDDYTLIGTSDVDGNTNTRIIINGNTRASSPGNISYAATSTGSHVFYTTNSPLPRMLINSSGNVGIGTTNPGNILQVGGAGRLKIGSGITDYTIIGTQDIDNNTSNTKIFINGMGNASAGAAGCIQYFATSATGAHVYYGGSPLQEIARLTAAGNLNTIGTITGTTITGTTITGTIINATVNLEESGVKLSTKYATKATDIVNSSNYASNISNVLNRNSSNYASNISNVINANTSNYASNISNVLNINSSNYASNISNVIIANSSNYTTNASNALQANINAKQATLTAATTLLGTGGSITGINYNTVINKPTYTSPLSSNATTNTISIDLSSYSITNDATYLKLDGSTKMTGGLNFNNLVQNKVISFYDASTPNNFQFVGLGASSGLIFNIFGTGDAFKFLVGATSTTSTEILRITGTGKIGIGTTDPGYSILQIGAGGPLKIAGSEVDYTVIGTSDYGDDPTPANNLNTKIMLTGINCTVRNSGCIYYYATGYSGAHTFYTNGSKVYSILADGSITCGVNNKIFDINGNIYQAGQLVDFTSYATKATDIANSSNYASNISNVLLTAISTNSGTSNYASNISNVLLTAISTNSGTNSGTSNYASNISNVLLTAISTNSGTSNYASNISNVIIANTNATYLKLAGGTLTGDFNIEKVSPIVSIKSSAESQSSIFYLSTPHNISSGLKTAIIAEGLSAWGRSKLHFCLNDNQTDNSTAQNASVSHARMTILPTGNIGIGTNDPVSKLTINNIVSDRWTYDHSTSPLTITNQIGTGTTLNDPQPILNLCRQGSGSVSYGARATFKLCRYENSGVNSRTRMDIVLANNRYDEELSVMSIRSDGNVGIGTTSPSYMLDVYTDNALINNAIRIRASTAREASLLLERSGTSWQIFNKGTGYGGAVNNLCFASSSVSSILEITQSGNVGIGTTNPLNILQVGNAGRLRISNGTTDYSLIGTLDSDGATNTRIVISGTTRASPFAGNIEYVATSATGAHIFYTTNSSTERMRIQNDGNIGINTPSIISGVKLDCRGTIYSHSLIIGDINTITANGNNVFTPGNYQLLIAPPTASTAARIETIKQGTGYNQNLTLQPTDGSVGIRTSAPTSGAAFDVGGTSTSTFYTYLNGLRISGRDISIYHNVPNNDMTFHTNWGSTASGNIMLCTRGTARLFVDGPTGNVGIGTSATNTNLHIEHASQTFNAGNGGLYVYNPNNVANHCSVLGARIAGATATNKAGVSLGMGTTGTTGWSILVIGSDTTDKLLRFNSSSDASGLDRLQIRGSDGYTNVYGSMTVGSATNGAVLTIGNAVNATTLHLTDIAKAGWKISTGSSNLYFQNDITIPGTFANKMTLTPAGNLTTTYGNFNNVITSNNTGLGDPVNGFIGGSGDRIILWPGDAATTPFSLGINTNTLWLSSPTNIKFFNNKIQTLIIGSTGQVGIGNPTPIGMLSIGRPDALSDGSLTISKGDGGGAKRNFKIGLDAGYNLCIGDFYNTTTIATNPWTSNQFTINYSNGNIGIGTVGNAFKLAVNGSVNIFSAVGTDPISILFKGTDYNVGIAGSSGNYSTSAIAGDMIIRTIANKNLLLQSGASGYGLKIDSNNNVNASNNLSVNGVISGNGSNITEINYNNITSNLLKLENQSVIRYPPTVMTGATTRFSSSSYANNGTYIASASTNTGNAWYCFDAALPITNFNTTWSPATALYRSTAPFDYTSTASFTIINGTTTVYGEWVQLYYDRGFVATNIVIWNNLTNSLPLPSSFILVGSINGNYWTLLSQKSGIVSYSDPNSINSYNINNYTLYNYYRLIVTNTIGSSSLTITELIINGLPNSTYVNTDNFNTIIYNTTEKQFPPRLYDTSSAETTYAPATGNELFGVVPGTVYKQTLTLNNHGIYTIYSSSTTGVASQLKQFLFDYQLISDVANSPHWFYNVSGSTGNYLNGNYIAAGTSCIKSDFKGDWIIIKLPYKIVLSRFRFYPRIAFPSRAPALWKCYGSNDGINFTEITEAANTQTLLTVNNYTLGYYENIISSSFVIPYLYIGWVVNQLVGASASESIAYVLNFNELQIFGKDDISNSYSKALTLLSDNRLIYNNISTITTYLTTANAVNLTNKYVRFNYQDEVYINSGTYNLTFGGGSNSINTSPVITKYTYPILKDSNLNIINPLIWYKFDSSPGIFIDSGSLNNGSLTTYGSILIDTTNYIHGYGSVSFTAVTTYYKVPNTIDLNAINLATGISFNLWVNITAAGNYGRIFDFGTTNGTSGTNYIMISREATNPNLKFEIFGTTTGINYVTSVTNYINTGWYNICWTITTTGVWSIYINSVQITLTGQTSVIPSISTVANRTYYIGKSLFSNDGFLTMYLDDFRIYGKVLSQTEVTELYKGRVEVYTKNTIGIGTTNPNINSILDVNGNTNISGNVGIGTTNPRCTLEVGGIACIHNGTPYAIANNFMQTGSLTIGGLTSNYGGSSSGWNANTAGLLMECYDNTEIAVHDGANRVASLMYYEGAGTNRITIGRDMGWGVITTVAINGRVGIGNASPNLNLDVGSTNANHNIGRAILTTNALNIHGPDKLDFLSIGRWDGSSTADWQFNGIKYGVITAADAGETANNHSCITFHTWGNSISNSREVMRLTSRGNLNIGYLTNYSANTKLNIKAPSYGYSQPLVRIEQTAGWDGNYCLQTVGYTDLGGIRINGGDTNSIYKTALTGDMGLTVNNGNMNFNVNGAERMRISTEGVLSIYGGYTGATHTIFTASDGINGQYKICFYSSGNIGIGGNQGHHLNFGYFSANANTSFTPQMTLNTTSGLLTCNGSSVSATSNYRYFNAGTVLSYANTNQVDVCAKFNGSIWVTSWIASSSDARIKKNIQDINDNSALVKILTIQPKTYEYIDNINKGTSTVYGFIAQQIKEIIPEAVKIENSIIPNIYKLCDCNDDKITIENNILEIDDKITIISINDDKEIKENYKIIEKIPELNQIRIDKNLVGSNCFVYGTEVNDFHTLNKDYIFTLNVCATQELHRLIEQQQQQITDLMRRIEILESK